MRYTFEDTIAEWKVDSYLDESNISVEVARTHQLHSKYLEIYMYAKAKHAAADKKYNTMQWIKRKYFKGQMEKHELDQYGWSQWQGLKPSNSELNDLFAADRDLNDLLEKSSYYKSFVSGVEYILKAITGRQWDLKTLVEYQKFQAGL
jgi:hypothetical protein